MGGANSATLQFTTTDPHGLVAALEDADALLAERKRRDDEDTKARLEALRARREAAAREKEARRQRAADEEAARRRRAEEEAAATKIAAMQRGKQTRREMKDPVAKELRRARKKFNQLDKDGSGALDGDEMHELARRLGADVPFALTGGTAIGTGRGDELSPALASGTFQWVLALADFGLSTPAVYRELDAHRERHARDISPADASPSVDTDVLQALGTDVVDNIRTAETQSFNAVSGEADTREVVDALMSAEQSLQTAIAIRDKLVTAYLEVSRMQI